MAPCGPPRSQHFHWHVMDILFILSYQCPGTVRLRLSTSKSFLLDFTACLSRLGALRLSSQRCITPPCVHRCIVADYQSASRGVHAQLQKHGAMAATAHEMANSASEYVVVFFLFRFTLL